MYTIEIMFRSKYCIYCIMYMLHVPWRDLHSIELVCIHCVIILYYKLYDIQFQIIIDDLSLDDSKELPPYIPVDLPSGISPEAFPKLALVADAIHFFKHIFTQPEDELNYNSGKLLHLLIAEAE